jgi:hypothetical protein
MSLFTECCDNFSMPLHILIQMTFNNCIPVLLTELRWLAEVTKDAIADYLIAYHGADRADQDNIHNTLLVLPTDVL